MPIADSSPIPVFISYSHDSPEHQRRVLDLSDRLRSDGIDAWIDQYTPWPEEGWPRRMEAHLVYIDLYHAKISTSKYVLIVFSAVDAQHIPPILQGHAHFCLDTDQGFRWRALG